MKIILIGYLWKNKELQENFSKLLNVHNQESLCTPFYGYFKDNQKLFSNQTRGKISHPQNTT